MSEPVAQRRYTLSEIDRMRRALRIRLAKYYDVNIDVYDVENELRTAMMAGIVPLEIENSARTLVSEELARLERYIVEAPFVEDEFRPYDGRLELVMRLKSYLEELR